MFQNLKKKRKIQKKNKILKELKNETIQKKILFYLHKKIKLKK